MRHNLNWDDLRYLLSVGRGGTLSAAARALKVDAGTVSRRITAMELALGARCFERRPDGYPLTEQGRLLFEHAVRVEQEMASFDRAVDYSEPHITGVVGITATESVANAFLLPSLSKLRLLHPELQIELVVDDRILNLSKREVDIALRFVRSNEGELLSRKIATLNFGLYASASYLEKHGRPEHLQDLSKHVLIGWLEECPRAAPAIWLHKVTEMFGPFLRVNSATARTTAAELGLGITLLPFFLVGKDSCLQRVMPNILIPPLEIWLLAHPEAARIKRVRATMNFIVEESYLQRRIFTGA